MGRVVADSHKFDFVLRFRTKESKQLQQQNQTDRRLPVALNTETSNRLDKPQTGMLFTTSSARGGDSGQLQQTQYNISQFSSNASKSSRIGQHQALWELSRLRRQSRRALLQRVEAEQQQNHQLRVEQGQKKPSFSLLVLSSSGSSSTGTSRTWHGTTALTTAAVLRELSWLRRKGRRALLLQLVVDDDVVGRHIDVEESMEEPRQQEPPNVELERVGDSPASIFPANQRFGIDGAKALAGMRGRLLSRSTIVRPEVRARHG
jgi:hypothetical protein